MIALNHSNIKTTEQGILSSFGQTNIKEKAMPLTMARILSGFLSQVLMNFGKIVSLKSTCECETAQKWNDQQDCTEDENELKRDSAATFADH